MGTVMLQEDSNGEGSFEIIDKKSSELSIGTESLSSVSSAYSLTSPSLVNVPSPSPTGNLLSNVAPPSSIPDFTLLPSASPSISSITKTSPQPEASLEGNRLLQAVPVIGVQFPVTHFSAAIPPSKGIQHGPVPQVPPMEPNQGTGGFIGWMKDAVSSGGLLHKVAEKAKSSVDTLITTLDPQMSEFIYSGGDLEVTVVSQNEDDIHSVREAFYAVFGKAWINNAEVSFEDKLNRAVGFDQASIYAKQKLDKIVENKKLPTIIIQDVLLQQNLQFYDLSLILLKDTDKNVSLQTFTQTTPLPTDVFLRRAEKELPDYSKYSHSKELALAAYLQSCKDGWRELITGVPRAEILYLATKGLVQMYKNLLDSRD